MQELLAFLLCKRAGEAGLRQIDQLIDRKHVKTDAAILAGCDQVFPIRADGYRYCRNSCGMSLITGRFPPFIKNFMVNDLDLASLDLDCTIAL
jgi:hypothetical protein